MCFYMISCSICIEHTDPFDEMFQHIFIFDIYTLMLECHKNWFVVYVLWDEVYITCALLLQKTYLKKSLFLDKRTMYNILDIFCQLLLWESAQWKVITHISLKSYIYV